MGNIGSKERSAFAVTGYDCQHLLTWEGISNEDNSAIESSDALATGNWAFNRESDLLADRGRFRGGYGSRHLPTVSLVPERSFRRHRITTSRRQWPSLGSGSSAASHPADRAQSTTSSIELGCCSTVASNRASSPLAALL